MATTVIEKIKVAELSKFGFKVGTEYVNYSKQIPEKDKAFVVPGAEFEAEMYVADSGKRYLNKVVSQVLTKATPPTEDKAADTERAKRFVPKFEKKEVKSTESMSKAEWQAKDRSQLIGGLSHDAATLVATMGLMETEGLLEAYKSVLEGLLKIRDEIK